MKQVLILMILSFITHTVSSQDYAVFRTDSSRFKRFKGNLPNHITNQVWYINGKEMKYGSGTVKVLPNPKKLDTILYRKYYGGDFDTIICNISDARKFTFYYNSCCGAFNVRDDSLKRFNRGRVIFNLKHLDDKKTYLGTLGESGLELNKTKSDTLQDECRSAMSPNVYRVSLNEISKCRDSSNCEGITCLKNNDKEEIEWGYEYEMVSKKFNTYYLPLYDKPLIVVYDFRNGELKIEL